MHAPKFCFTLLVPALLSGCVVVLPEPGMPAEVAPRHVAVLTSGVEIVSDDGEWKLAAGRPQQPPFQSPVGFPVKGSPLDRYEQAMSAGARLVRVKVPQLDEPLFGVLRLGGVYETTKDTSAKRVYRIQVPEKHVHAALGGQVSVVYQPYDFVRKVRRTDELGDHYYADQKSQAASWILWLSDAPFPGQGAATPTPTPTPTPAPDAGR